MRLHPYSVLRGTIDRLKIHPLIFAVGFGLYNYKDTPLTYIVGFVLCYVLIYVVREGIRWYSVSYRLEDTAVETRSGIFDRQHRVIPYDRIQESSVVQNGVDSFLGIANVSCETAGSSKESELELRYVGIEEAERIQDRLGNGNTVSTEDEKEKLYRLRSGMLFARSVLSSHPKHLFLAISVAMSIIFSPPWLSDFLTPPLPASLVNGHFTVEKFLVVGGATVGGAWVVGVIQSVLEFYDTSVEFRDGNIHQSGGFVWHYSNDIPLDNVQLLRISTNPLQNAFGFARLTVESAGAADFDIWPARTPVIPLGNRSEVEEVAKTILDHDDPEFERPPKRMRRRLATRYLIVLVLLTLFFYAAQFVWSGFPVPWLLPLVGVPFALVAAHIQWRYRGVAIYDDHLAVRNGILVHSEFVVPLANVQSLSKSQSILQRRFDLATLSVETAASLLSAGTRATDFDTETVEMIYETVQDGVREVAPRTETRRGVEPEQGNR